MKISIGFLENPERVLIKDFSPSKELIGESIVPLENLDNLDGLFLAKIKYDQTIIDTLEDMHNHFPINHAEKFSLEFDMFRNIKPITALNKLKDLKVPWILKNNLNLIENLYAIVSNLKIDLLKDRENALTELWRILRKNLGAFGFFIFFNDLEEGNRKIVTRKITGSPHPSIHNLSENDQKILDFLNNRQEKICFYEEKYEFFAKFNILGSPVVIWGGVFIFTPLQKSLLNSFSNALI